MLDWVTQSRMRSWGAGFVLALLILPNVCRAQSFRLLGTVPDRFWSAPFAVNADGSVAVGEVYNFELPTEAVRWVNGQVFSLGFPP